MTDRTKMPDPFVEGLPPDADVPMIPVTEALGRLTTILAGPVLEYVTAMANDEKLIINWMPVCDAEVGIREAVALLDTALGRLLAAAPLEGQR